MYFLCFLCLYKNVICLYDLAHQGLALGLVRSSPFDLQKLVSPLPSAIHPPTAHCQDVFNPCQPALGLSPSRAFHIGSMELQSGSGSGSTSEEPYQKISAGGLLWTKGISWLVLREFVLIVCPGAPSRFTRTRYNHLPTSPPLGGNPFAASVRARAALLLDPEPLDDHYGRLNSHPTFWLRTCYEEQFDAIHSEMLENLEWCVVYNCETCILNDASIFDLGDAWEQIFEKIPEALLDMDRIDYFQARPHAFFDSVIRELNHRDWTIDDLSESEYPQLTEEYHRSVTEGHLYIVDKIACETGKLLVVAYDDCLRVVRKLRLSVDETEDFASLWTECIDEYGPWVGCPLECIGVDYLPGGACALDVKQSEGLTMEPLSLQSE